MRLGRKTLWAGVVAAGLAAAPIGFALYASSLPPLDLEALKERSTIVVDREGKLLRPFVMADGRWRMPVTAKDVDPRYLSMLIDYEDRRFWKHAGIDPMALVRAGFQLIRHGRVVSGGSTLSMQVARLAEPRENRSLGAKLRQMARALELERRVGKAGILDLYLSLAPFGGNLEGVRAASLAYFGKEPARLSTSEAALLVAIPQSPEVRRPDRFLPRALAARNRVLERIRLGGLLPEAEIARGEAESIPEARRPFPNHAAHRAEALVAADTKARRIETSLDYGWQVVLERLALDRAEALGPKLSVAMVVVENETGLVRASVGGADYFNATRKGGIDLSRAIRSPGSALKPFIYALAFENGIAHPETMLEDRPHRFGTYAPDNFDFTFQGMVSARQALQMSLNLPAVDLLQLVGAQRFLSRLREAGANIETPDESAPGLAIGLGGLGISLQDLTMLYSGLARGGAMLPLAETAPGARPLTAPRFVGHVPAWYIADILIGAPPPENAPPLKIAYKTGTSFGYRDAWAVGFDRKHTIGVWVGQADNGAVPGLVGRKVAAPILFDAFSRIGLESGLPPRPREALVATNATLPPPLRHVRQDIPKSMAAMGRQNLAIAFPPDGAAIDAGATQQDGKPWVVVKITGGSPPFTYMLNGLPVHGRIARREAGLGPEGLGFTQISVMDSTGATDQVTVRLQ
ncbi:MAG: penicillin-binding protein 1C [Rhizobiales bacterium PAR1]|nr:MAG: penicillin-binding protein 1C [Rhizobiales bacterium PAR1]